MTWTERKSSRCCCWLTDDPTFTGSLARAPASVAGCSQYRRGCRGGGGVEAMHWLAKSKPWTMRWLDLKIGGRIGLVLCALA